MTSKGNQSSQTLPWKQSGKSGTGRLSHKNGIAIMVDVHVPNPDTARSLTNEFAQVPGIKRAAFVRDDIGTPHVQFQATEECLPMLREILDRLAVRTQEAYRSSPNYSS